jgi:hypothetical protein
MRRRARPHQLVAVAMVAAAALLPACATQPLPPVPPANPTPADVASLIARERVLNALQTPAVMEYAGPDGHFKTREQITVRLPACLRVEALSPMGVALVVAAGPTEIAVFDPSKNTIARGAATAATLDRVARIPLAPAQAARILLALPPDAAQLAAPPTSSSDENGLTLLSYAAAGATVDAIAFAGGDLAMVRETSADGTVAFEVRYSDWRDIGAMRFPHTIDASFPASATTLKLRYENPLIDGAIPDTDFVLAPGPQTKELRLGLNSTDAARA